MEGVGSLKQEEKMPSLKEAKALRHFSFHGSPNPDVKSLKRMEVAGAVTFTMCWLLNSVCGSMTVINGGRER